MNKMLIIDGHSDFLEKSFNEKMTIDDKKLMFNLDDAYLKRPYIQFSAIFINSKYTNENIENGYIRTNDILNHYEKNYEILREKYNLINVIDLDSLNKIKTQNKIGIVLTIENMDAIGGQISKIEEFFNKGVIIMSLTWNNDNLLACGAKTKNDIGISDFGIRAINKMNELGIVVDVSHLSRNSFFDLVNINQGRIIATHSCVNSLCENVRNLTDGQIKYIAKKGGIIGVCFYNKFLTNKKEYATIDDIIDHITYIANLTSILNVGIGSDFDGISKEALPVGINGVQNLENLIDRMLTRGFSNFEVSKIMGENFYNYLHNIFIEK